MTSRTSASGKSARRGSAAALRRNGFTLIELLVVIGIIVVLAGLLLPAITGAYKKAQRAAMANDLQAVGAALDAYKRDFGDYPRVHTDPGLTPMADRPNPMTGAQMLCFALVGPAPKTEVGVTPTQRPKQDGQDGPGFRVLRLPGPDGTMNTPDDDLTVKPAHSAYLSDTFRYGDPMDPASPSQVSHDETNVLRYTLLDRNNKPILYFPASATKRNVTLPKTAGEPAPYVDSAIAGGAAQSESSRYDADDNIYWFADDPTTYATATTFTPATDFALPLKRIRVMLGDVMGAADSPSSPPTTPDGIVQQYETPVDLPYLLWSSGPDEKFGPRDGGFAPNDMTATVTQSDRSIIDKCDDVTNFRQ
jgi:prepilin-type N-terminal cleavage/methylation domain-containing protein